MTNQRDDELREKLAAIEHERWADWQKWCHKVLRENNPSPEQGDILERWDRQIETPYSELSDKEKASDMEQADRYWHLILADRTALLDQLVRELPKELTEPPEDCAKKAYAIGIMAGKNNVIKEVTALLNKAKGEL